MKSKTTTSSKVYILAFFAAVFAFAALPGRSAHAITGANITASQSGSNINVSGNFLTSAITNNCVGPGINQVIQRQLSTTIVDGSLRYEVYTSGGTDTGVGATLASSAYRINRIGTSINCGDLEGSSSYTAGKYDISFSFSAASLAAGTYQLRLYDTEEADDCQTSTQPASGSDPEQNGYQLCGTPAPSKSTTATVTTFSTAASTGTIYVRSNLATGFSMSGASSFMGSVPANTTVAYSSKPSGSYTIIPAGQIGYNYSVSPSQTQPLSGGSSITFTITYTGTGGAPGSFSITSGSCFGWPSPKVEINISQPSGADTYNLERSTGAGYGTVVSGLTYAQFDSYADSSVSSGTTYTYRVKAVNSSGSTYSSNTQTITVNSGNCGGSGSGPSVSLTANPSTINAGDSSTLTWTVSNATSCTASDGWSGAKSVSGGSQSVTPAGTTTYTITCSNANGSNSATTTITVNGGTAPKPTVTVPGCSDTAYTATISWPNVGTNMIVFVDYGVWPNADFDSWENSNGNTGVSGTSIVFPTGFVPRLGDGQPTPAQPGYTYTATLQRVDNGSDGPSTSWTVPTCPNPTVDSVTINSPTVSPDNTTQYTISVKGTLNVANGGSMIYKNYAFINYNNGSDPSIYRGYLVWSSNNSISAYKDFNSCTGAGYAAIINDPTWAASAAYLRLDSCSASISGDGKSRISNFVVRFDPSFTTPTTNNRLDGYTVTTNSKLSGWVDFPGFDLAPKATISIDVVPTITTSWVLNGPDSDNCVGCSDKTYPNVNPGSYYLSNVANVSGYSAPVVTPPQGSGNSQTVGSGDSASWTISYPPSKPAITNISNSVCEQLDISWSNSTNETGYEVWRSTGNAAFNYGSGDGWTNIASRAADVTSYSDTSVVGNTSYYYIIVATGTGGKAASNSYGPTIVLPCAANLGNSSKNLKYVQKAGLGSFVAYDKDTTTLNDGDVLRFWITIVNSGTAAATINYIDDTMTKNLVTPASCPDGGSTGNFCMQVDKGSGFGVSGTATLQSSTSTSNTYRLAVSGNKAVGDPNWVIQFDAKLASVSGDIDEYFKNTAGISYTDGTGTHTQTVSYGPVLFKKKAAKSPTFKEVSP